MYFIGIVSVLEIKNYSFSTVIPPYFAAFLTSSNELL